MSALGAGLARASSQIVVAFDTDLILLGGKLFQPQVVSFATNVVEGKPEGQERKGDDETRRLSPLNR